MKQLKQIDFCTSWIPESKLLAICLPVFYCLLFLLVGLMIQHQEAFWAYVVTPTFLFQTRWWHVLSIYGEDLLGNIGSKHFKSIFDAFWNCLQEAEVKKEVKLWPSFSEDKRQLEHFFFLCTLIPRYTYKVYFQEKQWNDNLTLTLASNTLHPKQRDSLIWNNIDVSFPVQQMWKTGRNMRQWLEE